MALDSLQPCLLLQPLCILTRLPNVQLPLLPILGIQFSLGRLPHPQPRLSITPSWALGLAFTTSPTRKEAFLTHQHLVWPPLSLPTLPPLTLQLPAYLSSPNRSTHNAILSSGQPFGLAFFITVSPACGQSREILDIQDVNTAE